MGQVKVPAILRFPNDDDFLFNHVWGKTFWHKRDPQSKICIVRETEQYMQVAQWLKINLARGYLSPSVTLQGGYFRCTF